MIGAAIRKDTLLLIRDRGALTSLFALPVVFMIVFGAMFQTDSAGPRTIATWHAPDDPRGAAVDRALDTAKGLIRQPQVQRDGVRELVESKRVDAGIVVHPQGVDVVVYRGLPPQARAPLEAALQGLVIRALIPAEVDLHGVNVVAVPATTRATESLSSFQISVPGNAVLFGFFLALTVAISFANERRTGTWQRLLAAPVPQWHALAAMLIPYGLIGVGQLGFFFSLGIFVFGMEVSGSMVALMALSLALVFCAVSLGLLFAAVGGSERQIGGLGSVILLVMGMLGGCMVPRQIMPPVMKSLGLAVPHGWALDGYYKVLVTQATSIVDIVPELTALVLFGTVFAAIGLVVFRFERV